MEEVYEGEHDRRGADEAAEGGDTEPGGTVEEEEEDEEEKYREDGSMLVELTPPLTPPLPLVSLRGGL